MAADDKCTCTDRRDSHVTGGGACVRCDCQGFVGVAVKPPEPSREEMLVTLQEKIEDIEQRVYYLESKQGVMR